MSTTTTRRKRTLALFLAFVMLFSMLPLNVFAANGVEDGQIEGSAGTPCHIQGTGYQSLTAAIEAAKGLEKPITITMDGNCAENVAVPIGVTVYFGSYSYTGTATAIEEQGKIAVLNYFGKDTNWYQLSVFEAIAVNETTGGYYTEQTIRDIVNLAVSEGESVTIKLLANCTSTIDLPEGVLLKTDGFECSGGVYANGGEIANNNNGDYYVKPYLDWSDDYEMNFTDIQEAINTVAEWGGGTISLQHNYKGNGEFTLPEGVTLCVGDYNFNGTVKDASGNIIKVNGKLMDTVYTLPKRLPPLI